MSKKTLQDHLETQGTCFCGVTHDMNCADKIRIALLDFPFWAYIHHDPDNDDGTEHIHFMLKTNGTRKIKHIADKLELPGNFIQLCKNEVGMKRYFLHLDSPDKKKYTVGDVHTNDHTSFRQAENGTMKRDILELWHDFTELRIGKTTPQDFIVKNAIELEKMPFYQKIKTFDIISKVGVRST